jgi:N-methylhydantoinase A
VFFMNSYANPAHEEQVAERLRALLPGVYITHSTELTREWYEYERTSTVAANAYVGPQVATYIRRLESDMQARGFRGSLFMMGSNGGLLSSDRSCRQPVSLVESGPIGGCIGAGAFAEQLGFKNVVAFDMGGTTAKCALVEEGRFNVESVYYAGGYVTGFPIKAPVVDIVEVGSGGGSIAWLDQQNRLHVGPKSAGSTPGPVCYGRGGVDGTVTDANLVLGRIDPEGFLGGELKLDKAGAEAAMLRLSGPLGFTGSDAALRVADGVLAIGTVLMAGAIRQVSVEHGLDPRDFVLFSYGGNGPLHASALAAELSIPLVVVPPAPGNFSAVGMLLADARIDLSQTFTGVLSEDIVPSLEQTFARLEAEAADAIKREFGENEVFFERYLEMRYLGQRHNIKAPVAAARDLAMIRAAFEHDYKRRYGHSDPNNKAEIQAVHLSAVARRPRPELAALAAGSDGGRSRPERSRPVYFGSEHGFVEAKILDRGALAIGYASAGPAVVEEYGSTTLVGPGDRFEVGPLGEIRIYCGDGRGAGA